MCHLYITKCQYNSQFHVCLKSVITRTHYRWKGACEKHVYRLKPASLRPGLPSIYIDYQVLIEQSNDVLNQVVIAYEIYVFVSTCINM